MTNSGHSGSGIDRLPPLILTSEPNSFARRTFEVRIPQIIDQVISTNNYAQEIVTDLQILRSEVTSSSIRPLTEPSPDTGSWNSVARPYLGKTWLEVPWYFAEAYFYRRLLEAVRYFQPGSWQNCDPFRALKQEELRSDAGPRKVKEVLRNLQRLSVQDRTQRLTYASLWGNRADLSNKQGAALSRGASPLDVDRTRLLADDVPIALELLRSETPAHLDILCDNAGTEILLDLLLAEHLLRAGTVDRVTLHLKSYPFYVSDAIPADVFAALEALTASGDRDLIEMGSRLQGFQSTGELRLRSDPFWTSAEFLSELPAHLEKDLSEASLVIVKGDANYRRLVGDYHWPPTTPFAEAVRSFPTSALALRTLKSELIVGLPIGVAERMRNIDPDWMVDGNWGVAQSYPKNN